MRERERLINSAVTDFVEHQDDFLGRSGGLRHEALSALLNFATATADRVACVQDLKHNIPRTKQG